jgi:phosphatidylserine/phosphatidylglycerophosphate/cardiolipin synthase-like enzyme
MSGGRTVGAAVVAGVAWLLMAPGAALASDPVPAAVSVCFTPAERCTPQIVAAIETAQHDIRVQAYGLTSAPILDALAQAHRRGVDVRVILDRSDVRRGSGPGAVAMQGPGVPIWVDAVQGIAHSIVIDAHLVIGGSLNYTNAAGTRNVENVTFVESAELAARYLANWEARRDRASRYQ